MTVQEDICKGQMCFYACNQGGLGLFAGGLVFGHHNVIRK